MKNIDSESLEPSEWRVEDSGNLVSVAAWFLNLTESP